MEKLIILFILILVVPMKFIAQQRVGINTDSPVRTLDVTGTSDQFIRVHSSSAAAGVAGLELLRGGNDLISKDWKIVNDGAFRIWNSDDNFVSGSTEVLRINSQFNTGIGTNSPQSKLSIDDGNLIAFGGHGYLKIGTLNSYNLAFDNSQIVALSNYSPSPLYFQANGGNTHFGLNGGNTLMSIGGGGVGVGTSSIDAPLNIVDDGFQLLVANDSDDANNWYIGASNDTWQAGDEQLLFSPSSSSADAVLRLRDGDENDGINAPVMIHSTEDHTILMDGNEIDTRGTPLYINHNTDEETYINPSGGRVGIGTTNPQAMLHVNTGISPVLSLSRDNTRWNITPQAAGNENLLFYWYAVNTPYAEVDGATGQWFHLSDKNFKENITPLPDVLENLKELNIYSYSFKEDAKHQDMVGIIAQEAESLFPEMVKVNEGQYGVAYSQLAAVGIKAIQEQQVLIESLQEKIKTLKANLTSRTEERTTPLTH